MRHWLGFAVGAALVSAFLPPLLAGSTHTCPVLRQKDTEHGPSAEAVPAFARKYNVDCTYCHTAWPQLNRTGYIFRRLGYRMAWEVPVYGAKPAAVLPPDAAHPGTKPQTNPITGTIVPPAISSGLTDAVKTAASKVSPETIAGGQKVFQQMQCFTCHANGDNIINPAKPIKGANFLRKYPEDAQIALIIRQGITGTAMPSYAKDRLSDDQLNFLIAYVRSLTPTPETAP